MKIDELTNKMASELGYRGVTPEMMQAKADEINAIASAALGAIIDAKGNLNVRGAAPGGVSGHGHVHGAPEIDEPDVKSSVDDILLKLIMYLQLETDDKQVKIQQDRIDSEKDMIANRHADMRDKISKNLKAMDKAAKTALLSKILGWAGAALAVIVAIVVSVATFGAGAAPAAAGAGAAVAAAAGAGAGGAAAGGAAAAGAAAGAAAAGAAAGGAAAAGATIGALSAFKAAMAIASAVIAVTSQILNETGGMEKINSALADSLKSTFNLDTQKAKMWAQIVSGVLIMGLQLGTGIAGGSGLIGALSKLGVVTNTAKLSYAMFLGGTAFSAFGIGVQGYNISAQYDSAITSAEVTDAKSWLQLIQQMLDETQEDLEEILAKVNELMSHMFDVLNSEYDAQKEIANQLGQMA